MDAYQRNLTKQQERAEMQRLAEQRQRQREIPAEKQHYDPAWVAAFWKRLAS